MQAQVPVVEFELFDFQSSSLANAPSKAVEDDAYIWATAIRVGDPFEAQSFGLVQPQLLWSFR